MGSIYKMMQIHFSYFLSKDWIICHFERSDPQRAQKRSLEVVYHFLLERNFVTINEIRPAAADRPPIIIMVRFGLLTEYS